MPATTSAIPVDAPVVPVATQPGGAIVLRGSLTNSAHAVVIDACQTGSSEGVTDGQHGLFDYAAGGWQLVSRDWASHTCRFVATGNAAPSCAAAGISGACLPSRLRLVANQLPNPVPVSEFRAGLVGGMQLEVLTPTESAAMAPPVPPSFLSRHAVSLGAGVGALVVALVGARVLARKRRTPEAMVRRVAQRVRSRLTSAEPVYQRLGPMIAELSRQAGELSALRDRLRAKFQSADRPALERRRDELGARAAASPEAAEARGLVEEQLCRVDRWRDESDRAAARLDRVLEYLRALEARLDDAFDRREDGARTGVRVEEDARLLKELERDVESSLEGAREADGLLTAQRSVR